MVLHLHFNSRQTSDYEEASKETYVVCKYNYTQKRGEIDKCIAKDYLKDFETTVSGGHTFSKIHRYLQSINKSANIPPFCLTRN